MNQDDVDEQRSFAQICSQNDFKKGAHLGNCLVAQGFLVSSTQGNATQTTDEFQPAVRTDSQT